MMITRGGAVQFSKTVVTLVKAVENQKTMKKKSNFSLMFNTDICFYTNSLRTAFDF